jgi:phosphoglycerate dehydrogenase-like enzyme
MPIDSERMPMTATRSPKTSHDPAVIMITSPLEQEYVERIASVDPQRTRVIYRPDLMPPTRYIADHNGVEDWKRTEEQEREWRSLLAQADVLWDFYGTADATPLDLSPRLAWTQTTSAGVGQWVRRLGLQDSEVIVTTASGVHGGPLSEFVFAALLFHVKRFRHLLAEQAEHRWERFSTGELTGMNMAIVGPGRIGQQVAKIARAFNMTVWVMGRTNHPGRAAELGVDRVVDRSDLHDLLGWADCIVLCTPHTDETEQLIDRAAIDAIKPGAALINIARGQVIDEPAMIEALRSGKIGFAAVDVVAREPLSPDSPLWDLPNVLISPHSASTAITENARITDIFVHNLRSYLDGKIDEMSPVLDKSRLY